MAFILSALEWAENRAVILLPNGVLASSQKQERALREQLIRENLLLAVISLPGSMFESTNIPTCLLVFDKHKETRKIALIDLTDQCMNEIRDQNGQFGGASHEGRTYHKTLKVIPDDVISQCVMAVDGKGDSVEFCVQVSPEQVENNNYELSPRRYFEVKPEISHRSFEDIAADYNRIICQKNQIKIRMNKTAAKRLGYDCMNAETPDLSESFGIVDQKIERESFITFSANDGIVITVSTKENIHPLILDFLNHWKQMIMYLNQEENRILAEFRDALLPELMSGKISIEKEEIFE